MDKPAIIEVALNEGADKAVNPHVPYLVDEIAADAVAASRAGASIVHFHARNAEGGQELLDADMCREIMEKARAGGCEAILYPTYAPSLPPETRLSHIWRLLEKPTSAPLELIDIIPSQHVGVVRVEARTGRFLPSPFGDGPVFPPDWTRIHEAGCWPHLGMLDISDLRYVIQAERAGLVPSLPMLLRFVMSQELIMGFPPTPSALDALLSLIPEDFPYHGIVAPNFVSDGEAVEMLQRHALARGLGIRVGLGDSADAYPAATNAERVSWAVAQVRDAGRVPATPAMVRELFGLSQLA